MLVISNSVFQSTGLLFFFLFHSFLLNIFTYVFTFTLYFAHFCLLLFSIQFHFFFSNSIEKSSALLFQFVLLTILFNSKCFVLLFWVFGGKLNIHNFRNTDKIINNVTCHFRISAVGGSVLLINANEEANREKENKEFE